MTGMSGSLVRESTLFGKSFRRGMKVQPATRLEDLAGYVVTDQRRQPGGSEKRGREIDAGVVAVEFEHMHEFFGTYVAARAGRIGAAAEPAQRCIEAIDADAERGKRIGKRHATRVVEVQREFECIEVAPGLFAERQDLRWIRHARGVAQGHAMHAQVGEALYPVQH